MVSRGDRMPHQYIKPDIHRTGTLYLPYVWGANTYTDSRGKINLKKSMSCEWLKIILKSLPFCKPVCAEVMYGILAMDSWYKRNLSVKTNLQLGAHPPNKPGSGPVDPSVKTLRPPVSTHVQIIILQCVIFMCDSKIWPKSIQLVLAFTLLDC